MLSLWLGVVSSGTYVPLAVGAFVGGTSVLVYLMNYQPSNDKEVATWPRRRQLALRIVAGVYLALACLLLVVALAVGEGGFVLTAGFLVALASGTFLSLWTSPRVGDQEGSDE
jgi:hypothetical protein